MSEPAGQPKRRRRRRRRGKNALESNDAASDRRVDLSGTFGPDRRRLRGLARKNAPDFAAELQASRDEVCRRIDNPLRITYPEELPFADQVEALRDAIEQHQVIVVCGETGSGKSTQLPKLCLELGRGTNGLIGHTQPRRLAARSVASRVASEIGVKLGEELGSKVRFGDETSRRTRVKVMTDGILLAESRTDRRLEQYDTIIVDEAHERSLNIDFLLGILASVLQRRPDLKLIITSATIDTTRFADHFEKTLHARVPVVEITGRTYPVDIRYMPPIDDEGQALDMPDAIAEAAETLAVRDGYGPSGDVLVFLPGEREIREAAIALRNKTETTRLLHGTEIVPLYARLSIEEQQRVFRASSRRRIVLATNVAETSLTVPGIRYVIDTGVARLSRYSSRRRVQSLLVEPISQASARQRAGRCGRTEPGVCVRLYEESDLLRRDEFTPPEIQRTNLAGVILQMRALGLGDPRSFPFIEPPDHRRIAEAFDTLRELGAVKDNETLTPIGERLSKLPVDPRIGRILIEAHSRRVMADALVIAAAIETQDPRERPSEHRAAADAKHARFADELSDYTTLLKLWDYYHEQKEHLSRSQLRKTLRNEYLSFLRLNEWTDTHRQLRDVCREMGMPAGRRSDRPDDLHASILAGFVTSVGKAHLEGGFTSPVAGRFHVHPGSAVKPKNARWVVATELVRTTRLYARACARVSADAVEEAAKHLITRDYDQPEYNPSRGIVEASMRVHLGAIEIARDRRVDYGTVDRAASRRVFIEQALVGEQLSTGAPFEKRNIALREQLRDEEAKLRKPRLPTDEALFRFFDERLGDDVCSARGFDRWRRSAERDDPNCLTMTHAALSLEDDEQSLNDTMPDRFEVGGHNHAVLEYRFAPGEADDGIKAILNPQAAAAGQVERLGWLVPGWLDAKVEAVLRGLPRDVRRQLELTELVRRVCDKLRYGHGDFFIEIAKAATEVTKLTITPAMCRSVELPPHLSMILRVEDTKAGVVAEGRDLPSVISKAREAAEKQAARTKREAVYIQWPTEHPTIRPPQALVDAQTGVRLMTLPTVETAAVAHWLGCRRLAGLSLKSECRPLFRHTAGMDKVKLLYRTLPNSPDITDDLCALLAEVNRTPTAEAPVSQQHHDKLITQVRTDLAARMIRTAAVLHDALSARQRVLARLGASLPAAAHTTSADVKFQAEQLFHGGTLRTVRWPQLTRLAVYFRGIEARLDRLRGPGLERDRGAMQQLMPHWKRCIERAGQDAKVGRLDPLLDQYRWMIEEYRLTLFAPSMAIRGGASPRKLDTLWAQLTGAAARPGDH